MITLEARLRATPNGLLAAALLSFLATAGLFYVNIMPAIIEGLSRGLGLTTREAGLIGSANIYGAAFGAFASVFLVRHLPWRAVTAALLVALMLVDLTSIVLESVGVLVGVRAVHGIVGGLLVGFAFSVIARTARPERTFSMLLIVQFGLGGLGVMFLPRLAAAHGTWVLFVALFAFSAVTLMMTRWLDDYAVERSAATQNVRLRGKHSSLFVLALLAVFLFQAANMALFSYILGLAGYFGLDLDFASRAVGAATWIGIAGSVLVIGLSTRRGRVVPLVTALVVTVIGFWLLHYSASKAMYVIANCGTGITWAFVMPYLLGMCAEFDEGGQAAAFGGFASKMGLASGPMLGALLLQKENYSLLISISSIGVLLCMVAAFIPARMLDMRRNPSRPPRDGIYP